MQRYAILENNFVLNVVLWDGETECAAIPQTAVALPDDSPVGPGYTYDGTTFTAPPEPPNPFPFA
jgi:hypothetical protein